MLCVNCGQVIEEGKPFCKNCGAPVPQSSETVASGASDLSATAVRPPSEGAAPPPPSFVPVTPPPAAMSGYGAGWQPPQGPPPGRNRTGLIVGSVAAAVIVLAGLGVGLWLGLRGDDGDKTTGATVVSSSTSGTGTGGTVVASSTTGGTGTETSGPGATGGETTTTAAGSTTTQTIPGLTTTTGGAGTTTTTADVLAEWYAAHDSLVTELDYEDGRVHELAIENINTTAPDVPAWVRDELTNMADTLGGLGAAMDGTAVPAGFEDAHYWLMQAVTHMANRIQATVDGIDAMWSTGSVGSATADFNEGRDQWDAYQAAMTEHWSYMPPD